MEGESRPEGRASPEAAATAQRDAGGPEVPTVPVASPPQSAATAASPYWTRPPPQPLEPGKPPPPPEPRMLSPMGWLNVVLRRRWRGRFALAVEDLGPPPASSDGEAEGEGEGGRGGKGGRGGEEGAAAPRPEQTAFRLDGPQADELGDEPHFRAVIAGVECCAVLPDGRERQVACGEAFQATGPTYRAAEQAAAALVRDWFVARGLWDPNTLEAPPPDNISLTVMANRHRAQSRLRSEDNPLVFLDLALEGRPGVNRVVLELFHHTEPAGAQCFLGMLHGASPDGGPAKSEDAPAGPPVGEEAALPPPPGAFGGRGLAGASFDSVLPSLLMAVGGAPKEAGELTMSPQDRALASAREEQEEDRGDSAGGRGRGRGRGGGRGGGRGPGGGGGRGRGRFGGRDGSGGRHAGDGGGGRGSTGRGVSGAAASEPHRSATRLPAPEPAPAAAGRGVPSSAGPPQQGEQQEPQGPPRSRYEQRFNRPFLVALRRDLPAQQSQQAPGSSDADGQPPGPASGGPAAGGGPTPSELRAAQAAGPQFLITLGPSKELSESHVAVGHVLSGYGALREAALAWQDGGAVRAAAAAARAAEELQQHLVAASAQALGEAEEGAALPPAAVLQAGAATAPLPVSRIVACGQLPRGQPPPPAAPLMLGAWPAWPEDLPPLAKPCMETEAKCRLEAARGIKEAGNAAFAAGDLPLALAHYRQGIHYLELITFTSDLFGAVSPHISYDTSLPMWETELALRLNESAALTALGRGAEALEALREMRIKAPGNAKVWFRTAQAHVSLGLPALPDALEALNKAAALAPRDPAILAALADVCGRIKRGQGSTRRLVSVGMARALGSGQLYGGDGGSAGGGDGGGGGGSGDDDTASAGATQVRRALAAELVGRHLGLDVVAAAREGALPYSATGTAAEMMAAWFQPRA